MPDDYRVEIVPSARKELESLHDPVLRRIFYALVDLSGNPRSAGCKKLVGSQSRYRCRAGDFRIIYEIVEASRVVRVFRIRHRRDAYR
jgi:mRNA interferase RelE/StbE